MGQNKQREYWKLQKRKQRERIKSQSQKYRRAKEKNRERKRVNKANDIAFTDIKKQMDRPSDGYSSSKTKWNATAKARKALRKSPNKSASVVNAIINRASHRKKQALQKSPKQTNTPKAKNSCSALQHVKPEKTKCQHKRSRESMHSTYYQKLQGRCHRSATSQNMVPDS